MSHKLTCVVTSLIINLWLIPSSAKAQIQCLTYEAFLPKKTSLDSMYRPIREVFDPTYRIRSKPVNGVNMFSEASRPERSVWLTQTHLYQRFSQHLLDLGVVLIKLKGIELFIYVNLSGSIDYIVYQLHKHTLSGFEQEQIHQSFCQFFAAYRFNLTGKSAYQVYSGFTLTGATLADKQAQLHRLIQNRPLLKREIRSLAGLATTQPDTVTILTLDQLELTDVPKALARFKNLQQLSLSDNELTRIPRFIFRLKGLTALNLSGNRLTGSALRCKKNHHLKRLNLQFNQLTNLPAQLPKNRSLESLWLGYNDLSAGLDARILRRLTQLKDLNLYRAKLTSLPATIGQLSHLQTLDLYYNQLRNLPAELAANQSLQQLALSYNELGRLPNAVAQLRQLKALYLRSNSLTNLPDQLASLERLEILDVSDNALEMLPACVLSLSNRHFLQELDISQNRIESLPTEFLETTRVKQLNIGKNPVTGKARLDSLLPLIHQLEARQTTVRY